MPKAKPVPFMPSDSQLLWKKDPRVKGLTLSKARAAVNKYIRNLVINLAGKPPDLAPPHHHDHPVSRPQISIGQKNYSKIGSYYVLVSKHELVFGDGHSELALVLSNFRRQLPQEYTLCYPAFRGGVHHAT
jgi:hypothetical protein